MATKDFDAIAAEFGGVPEGGSPRADSSQSLDDLASQFGGRLETAHDRGASLPVTMRGAMHVLNAPAFGFADELYGHLAPGDYKENRDYYRGAVDSFQDEHPGLALGGTVVGTLATGGPLAAVAKRVPGWLSGMVVGSASGALQGAGDSRGETAPQIGEDAAKGAFAGGAFGTVGHAGISGVTAVANNLMQRFGNNASVRGLALNRVSEALERDGRTGTQVAARLNKLGDVGVVADAAGSNTRGLLDTIAIQPGQTATKVENLTHFRQATRADRLTDSAGRALGVGDNRMPERVDQWIAQRSREAAPLYQQVHQLGIPVNGSLEQIIGAAKNLGAFDTAQKMATADRAKFTLSPDMQTKAGAVVSMRDLDYMKRGLDSLIERETDSVTGRVSSLGRTYTGLKNDLVRELDGVTTDPKTGVSLYRAAREAFSGPSQLIDAANLGRRSIFDDSTTIDRAVTGLSESEREAYRLGAFEALRNKLGAPNGQAEVLNLWKNRNMQEKLKSMFGDFQSFRSFARDVAAEARMKPLENVGRGSQTASREARMDDLNGRIASDLVSAATAAKGGNPASGFAAVKNLWGRVSTPETVRNEIGRVLMQPNSPEAQYMLHNLNSYMNTQQHKAAMRGAYSGLLGGVSAVKGLLDP